MNIVIELAFIVLTTSLTGSITYGVWYVFSRIFESQGIVHVIYYMLKAVILFFLIPVLFIRMKILYTSADGSTTGAFLIWTPGIKKGLMVLGCIWILGVIWKGIPYWKDIRQNCRIRKNCKVCQGAPEQQWEKICHEHRIIRKIPVLQGESIPSPALDGVFFPRIYLPEGEHNDRILRVAYTHELTHYRHKDIAFQELMILITCLHWFNPLIVKIFKMNKLWSEYYCDYEANRILGNTDEYIQVLLEMALDMAGKLSFTTVKLYEDKSTVLKRVERMKKYDTLKKMNRMTAAVWSLVFFLAGSITVCAAGNGFMRVYTKLYNATAEEIEEPLMKSPNNAEYIESVDAHPDIQEETMDADDYKAESCAYAAFIEFDIGSGARKQTNELSRKSGDSIDVGVSISPADQNVKVGIIEPSGMIRYIFGKGNISHSFVIDKSGNYKFFIENDNDISVNVFGLYRLERYSRGEGK